MNRKPTSPSHPKVILAALVGTLAIMMGSAPASAAIYVKVPGVDGEVATAGYDGGTWFEAFSGTYGIGRDLVESSKDGSAGLDIGVGRPLPIGMACHLNAAAAPLAQAAMTGENLGEVEIHFVDLIDPAPLTFGIVRLANARVKDFEMKTPGPDRPWFQAFFVYESIEIISRLPGPDGIEEQTASGAVVPDGGTGGGDGSQPGAALQAWMDEYFTTVQQQDPDVGGLDADVDRDGLATVFEYKLGRNPWDPADGPRALEHWIAHTAEGQFLEVSFVQRTDASTPDTRLDLQVSENLSDWTSGDGVAVLVSRTALEADREELVYRLTHPRTEKPRQFVRLSVDTGAGTP